MLLNILTFLVVIGGSAALLASTAQSQVGAKNQVLLQGATPGVSQSGHSNITGISRAGQFVGGGVGLTGLDASALAIGTVNAARLPSSLMYLVGAQTVTGAKTFSAAPIFGAAGAPFSVTSNTVVANLNADLLDGLSSAAFLQSIPNPLVLTGSEPVGGIIRGTNSSTVGGSMGVSGTSTATTGVVSGIYGLSNSVEGAGVTGLAAAATGTTYGVFGQSMSSAGYGVYGKSSMPTGVAIAGVSTGAGLAGYFESAATFAAVEISNTYAGAATNYGLRVQTDAQNSVGIIGYGQEAIVGIVDSTHTGGTAIDARNLTATGGYGVDVFVTGTNGIGVNCNVSANTGSSFGGWFRNDSQTGIGLYAESNATNPINGVGGYFQSDGDQGGIGAVGHAIASSGLNYGVHGIANSDIGRGVFGEATSIGATDTPYGVRGKADTATLGFGVWATGDMGASGVKPFRIDHPLDPENKYLLHYAAESPFPQNFYNGVVTTDSNGYAWVDLPQYFAEINENFKYQLTVLDDEDSAGFVMAKVSKKIKGNRFQIRTSQPNVEVSWEVKADRNDLRVRHNRPTDEREKYGLERGKYLHPEYYNQPKERGMDYQKTLVPKPVQHEAKANHAKKR